VASLELKGVRKSFGSTPVLDEISLTLGSFAAADTITYSIPATIAAALGQIMQ
jgi:hypothetical protein